MAEEAIIKDFVTIIAALPTGILACATGLKIATTDSTEIITTALKDKTTASVVRTELDVAIAAVRLG